MAFSSIEFTTISRANDYSAIKHNEDNKGFIDQANITQQTEKTIEQRAREVQSGDDAQWHQRNPDAKEKGNGEYRGDGGRNRKKRASERMVVKSRGGFDIKV